MGLADWPSRRRSGFGSLTGTAARTSAGPITTTSTTRRPAGLINAEDPAYAEEMGCY